MLASRLASGARLVVDGGLSTAVEALGGTVGGRLWTARLLSDSPVAGTLRTKVLDWGAEDGLDEDAASNECYDVILLSELVGLGEELQAELLKTFRRLLGPNTVAYSIAVDRGAFSLGFLWLLAWHPDEFLVEELQLSDRLGLDEDEVGPLRVLR